MLHDASRIAVFSKGTCIGLNGWIPVGGQVDPSSNVDHDCEIMVSFNFKFVP